MKGDWTDQLYCYPAKMKSKTIPNDASFGSMTGSALIPPSVASTSTDSLNEDSDDYGVLLWKVNPRPPNSEEVNT